MRVILAGQRAFGLAAYEMLIEEGHDIAAVWSPYEVRAIFDENTDVLTARAQRDILWETPAWDRNPEKVKALEVDLFVCAHSHDFIGRDSRAATKLGGIGYHPSLLPRHRGRDAVRWTIHMGDPIAGGSVYWLTDNVDGGPIAAQEHCHVRPGDDASSLWRRELFPLGIDLLARVLRDLERGIVVEVPQDESVATWEPSWERPPLHRPELPQIGRGLNGFEHRVTRDALHPH
jgi:methionyl-tRNA formyltransferase